MWLRTGLNVDGGATLVAALIGGIAFLAIEFAAGYTMGFRPPMAPADVFLITVAGEGPVRDLGFDFGPLLMATLFHLFLAVVFGFVLTFIIYRWSADVAAAAGALYGIVLLLVFAYTFDSLDELVSLRGILMLMGYLAYGIGVSAIYKRLAEPQ